jgi:uncharacterized protein YxjI
MDVRISSKFFSGGFEIATPTEILTTNNRSFGELNIVNSVGTQIARVRSPFFSSQYELFISGGGGYKFGSNGFFKPGWTCQGEGRSLEIRDVTEHWYSSVRKFAISDRTQTVAEISKTLFSNSYEVDVIEQDDWKLVTCIAISLSLSEHHSSDVPG